MTSNVISQNLPVPTARVGTADIVGFGTSGVIILRNSVNIQTFKVIANFGYDAGGWRVDKHVRLVADTTGNREADIVGFGENGVWISFNNGNNTFQEPKMVMAGFAYAADLRKTGRADIVGFAHDGVLVSLNNGDGSFAPAKLAVADFGYVAGGWRIEKHLRFLGDVYGTGMLDIIGFGDNQVVISKNNGNGTFHPSHGVVNGMCYSAGGWLIEKHPRFVADLTGNGMVDLIGFGDAGVSVALNNGNGTFQASKLVLSEFGYDGGWRVEKNPRFIADLTGNKAGDIVGFGNEGVYVALNNGDGTFQPAKKVINSFAYDVGGWRVEKHPRFPVDLTGDGCADIIGFGDNSVFACYNDGKGNFGPMQKLVDQFAYNGGEWSLEKTGSRIWILWVNHPAYPA
ncbi:Psathyrella Velutina lectin At 1.5a resolution [Flammula alnicola]|nr:Psathyrella Velutina lectin At 1.5a resolution [Flammula alnicola]